jgi:tRNA threonylcarbamoyladenosine biosynthesis protein TsaE
MKKEIITASEDETYETARELGSRARPGDVFALTGDLGAGKTIMAKGIARGLNVPDDVTSPTFTLMEIYEGDLTLYHFDLYRIDDERELDLLYFEEYWEGRGVCVIEWADRAGHRLPDTAIRLHLQHLGDDRRKIIIEYPDT